jgi:hypothetical protein
MALDQERESLAREGVALAYGVLRSGHSVTPRLGKANAGTAPTGYESPK